jgi:hypothetical protein
MLARIGRSVYQLLPAFHFRASDGQEIQVHILGGPRQLHALAGDDLTGVNSRGRDCRFNTQKLLLDRTSGNY